METRLLPLAVAGVTALTALLLGQHPVQAQSEAPTKLVGVINDYVEGGGGNWHVNGEWSAHVKGDGGTADFLASLTMVRSDLWVVLTLTDPTNPALRQPHTHHVSLVDGSVTAIANGWRISGAPSITSNGVAAFSGSTIAVDLIGGDAVAPANVQLTFNGAATGHFGTQPLDGVVIHGR